MKVPIIAILILYSLVGRNIGLTQNASIIKPHCIHDRPALPYEQRLYFKPKSAESCWGDIVQNGKIIYSNVHYIIYDCDIPEQEINAPVTFITQNNDTLTSAENLFYYNIHTIDANGKFMYHPYFYDNYADYWVQGTRRIVANNKMGLVNIFNEILIPPTDYNFISIARNGYFKAYKNTIALPNYDDAEQTPVTDGPPIVAYYNLKGEQITATQWDSLYMEGVATNNETWGFPFTDQHKIERIAQQLIAIPQVKQYIAQYLYDDPINYRFILYQKKQHYYFGLQQTGYPHLSDLMIIECNEDLSFIRVLENDMQNCSSLELWAAKNYLK